MNVLDLFSGIGGMSLGLERAGMTTIAFCEIDPFCRKVLAKHWPEVPCHDDIKQLDGYGIAADVVCGGFPCQDISFAGFGDGIDGDRSGLWSEMARVVREVRPSYVVVENVAALLVRGMERVLRDLSDIGLDAEWSVVSACALGAAHVRQRVFIVAYPHGKHGRQGLWNTAARTDWALQAGDRFESSRARQRARMANPSALYGGANGLPYGLDRNRGIGNAVVPAVVETIGRAIMEAA